MKKDSQPLGKTPQWRHPRHPASRRKQAWTSWIVCASLALVPLYLLSATRGRPDQWATLLLFVALAYDPRNELLYGLQREGVSKAATILLQFNAKGALIARTVLSNPIPVGPYPSPLAQLVLAEDKLLSIVYSSPEKNNASAATDCSLYLIDPRSGDSRPVRSLGVASNQKGLGTTHSSPPITLAEQQP